MKLGSGITNMGAAGAQMYFQLIGNAVKMATTVVGSGADSVKDAMADLNLMTEVLRENMAAYWAAKAADSLENSAWRAAITERKAGTASDSSLGTIDAMILSYNFNNWRGNSDALVPFVFEIEGTDDRVGISVFNPENNTVKTLTYARADGVDIAIQCGSFADTPLNMNLKKADGAEDTPIPNSMPNAVGLTSYGYFMGPAISVFMLGSTVLAGQQFAAGAINTMIAENSVGGVLSWIVNAQTYQLLTTTGTNLLSWSAAASCYPVLRSVQKPVGTLISVAINAAANSSQLIVRNLRSDIIPTKTQRAALAEGIATQTVFETGSDESEVKYKTIAAQTPRHQIVRETDDLIASWHYLSTACVFKQMYLKRTALRTVGLSGYQTGVWPAGEGIDRARRIENYRSGFADTDSVADAQVLRVTNECSPTTLLMTAMSAAILDYDGPARVAAQIIGTTTWDREWTVPIEGGPVGLQLKDGVVRPSVEKTALAELLRTQTVDIVSDTGNIVYLFNFPYPGQARRILFNSAVVSTASRGSIISGIVKDAGDSSANHTLHPMFKPLIGAIAALWETPRLFMPLVGATDELNDPPTDLRPTSGFTEYHLLFMALAKEGIEHGRHRRYSFALCDQTNTFHNNTRVRFQRALMCASGTEVVFR